MPAEKTVVWFDDDLAKRKPKIEAISKALGLRLVVIEKKTSDPNWFAAFSAAQKEKNLSTNNVALLAVDHYLRAHKMGTSTYDRGASLCSFLRMEFKDIPIIGVSSAKKDIISSSEKKEYAYFLNYSRLPYDETDDCEGVISSIRSIVSGYASIRKSMCKKQKVTNTLISLMKVPEKFGADILRVLPKELRVADLSGCANDVFAWFNEVLLGYQGVLVDTLAAASMIGVTEDYFVNEVVPKLSKECQYNGIFSKVRGVHFWRELLIGTLQDLVDEHGSLELSHFVEKLTADRRNWAKCIACKKPFTELVAYAECDMDDSANKRGPAHRECVAIAAGPCPIYFEPKYISKKGL